MTLRDFSQSGILASDGSLGAAVPSGKIIHPGGSIDIVGDHLTWSFDFDKIKELVPSEVMFEDFIQLWNMDDRSILRFARRWGPLRIDRRGEHLIPKPGKLHGREPLSAWRFFSRRALAVLRIAASLREGLRGLPEDWAFISSPGIGPGNAKAFFGMPDRSLYELGPEGWDPKKPMTVVRLRDQLAGELTFWMERYGVKLNVIWDASPQIELNYGGRILSAIALQLTLATLKERSLYTCSGCGVPYGRGLRKRPKDGDANFCEKCGTTEALRQAQKRRRERRAQARQLAGTGLDVNSIAGQVGSRVETVQRWLEGK